MNNSFSSALMKFSTSRTWRMCVKAKAESSGTLSRMHGHLVIFNLPRGQPQNDPLARPLAVILKIGLRHCFFAEI
jgi:hypothetical protein